MSIATFIKKHFGGIPTKITDLQWLFRINPDSPNSFPTVTRYLFRHKNIESKHQDLNQIQIWKKKRNGARIDITKEMSVEIILKQWFIQQE
jgi:hypothetical protein